MTGVPLAPVFAVVPARAGSKGLPGKNVTPLAGKPLYRHSIDAALAAGIREIHVTTDIPEILEARLPEGVTTHLRPPHLAADTTTMAEVLLDFLPRAGLTQGTLVLLQPTSPLRRPETIRAGLDLYAATGASMVMSVSPAERSVLKWGLLEGDRFVPIARKEFCFANRQSLPPVVRPNGALYVYDAGTFLARGDYSAEDIRVLPIADDEAQDIDTAADLARCAALLGSTER
ncbi:NTP transferase domain-containing protein [Microvirga tunisiensis]|uniref:NTP transferase domain-containing protein n=1 Tax=Pannonibacter tanglangensis TaxID=2750084 RepID=A0A7X5J853_9HYPH|nr:acylneuraminate cytidylyltransferase family protein [Pannonibacter sp. XCT-53]NBN78329.1 NTP transferase domain-containing protein [Pannonibacter sp. XCT-53]